MIFYTDEEFKKIGEAYLISILQQDGKTHSEIVKEVVGEERFEELLRLQKEWDEENILFEFYHPDGSKWTDDDIYEWVLNKKYTRLNAPDMDGLYINELGDVLIADECGNFEFVDPDEFIVVWKRKAVEKLLEQEYAEWVND